MQQGNAVGAEVVKEVAVEEEEEVVEKEEVVVEEVCYKDCLVPPTIFILSNLLILSILVT